MIAILHSIRSKIDKQELRRIGQKAQDHRSTMTATMFAQFFESLKRKSLEGAFQNIEVCSQRAHLRQRAYLILERLCAKRVGVAYLTLKKAGQDSLAEKASYCEGALVLFRFFYRRTIQEKSFFFHAGKQMFEEDRKNAPSSAKKAKLIKSPSLVLEISQNFKIGYQVLGMIARKKIQDSFR